MDVQLQGGAVTGRLVRAAVAGLALAAATADASTETGGVIRLDYPMPADLAAHVAERD
jgi:hypothetical protein